MTVIIIKEEYHGFIGVADSVVHAIDFLIDKNWLTKYTDVFRYAGNGKWIENSVEERFGTNWEQIIKQFCLEDFNNIFDGCFYFSEEMVYTGEG